jgi:hypothetical protein
MACSPYTPKLMNVNRFHVSCIQKTDYRPHFTSGGLLDFLEHFKHTGRCVKVVRLSANCVVHSKRINKLCTHAHHSDRSVAEAIFANGTYFVDTPRIIHTHITKYTNTTQTKKLEDEYTTVTHPGIPKILIS